MSDDSELTGRLLIAMPDMGDPRFDHTVIYLCAHSEDGAMGIIINKPNPEVRFAELLDQLSIEQSDRASSVPVHYGGPVETGRGFVLHTSDYQSGAGTMPVTGGIAMTATLDILEDIASGTGPACALLALGYSGWGPAQLEGELARNAWLVCDATINLLFDTPGDIWTAALKSMGINPLMLSASGGTA